MRKLASVSLRKLSAVTGTFLNSQVLRSILQKHIKRQIISLNGGFKLIADLNAYHAFIAGLKVYTW